MNSASTRVSAGLPTAAAPFMPGITVPTMRPDRPGACGQEHIHHGGAFDGVRRWVDAPRAAWQAAAGTDRLPSEPRRRNREHGPPDGGGDGAELRFEHPGHRDAHQDMQPVGVEFGALAAPPGTARRPAQQAATMIMSAAKPPASQAGPLTSASSCAGRALGTRRRGGRLARCGAGALQRAPERPHARLRDSRLGMTAKG